jgi:STAS-like domain of unknown function (DUF4325)
MTTFAPCQQMQLADEHGVVLGGRVLGEQIRAEVVRQVRAGGTVVLDLAGVEAISPSFADEIFGKLPAEVGDGVEFANVSDQLQAVANMARAGRADHGSGPN